MLNPIGRYRNRLLKYDIRSCDVAVLKESLKKNNPKFHPEGEPKAFYGLTCIVRINQKSWLFHSLCELQNRIKKDLENAQLDNFFSFLKPESFHMTICDIEAGPAPVQVDKINIRVRQLREVFDFRDEIPKHIYSQIRGLGLQETITALVRFDEGLESELENILSLEAKIKEAACVNIREFTGHVSLAYFTGYPGGSIRKIKNILLNYAEYSQGEFDFSQFDLTCFTNMNKYIPIMTIDLHRKSLIFHNNNLQKYKKELQIGGPFDNG
ncbi:DUF1868 domain-containing protein [bacterium]|nr:DUF1868 domain-containing protein [bacterium]